LKKDSKTGYGVSVEVYGVKTINSECGKFEGEATKISLPIEGKFLCQEDLKFYLLKPDYN